MMLSEDNTRIYINAFLQKKGISLSIYGDVSSKLYVAPSSVKHAGYGVFAKVPLRRHEFLTVYSGLILDREDTHNLRDKRYLRALGCFGFFCVDGYRKEDLDMYQSKPYVRQHHRYRRTPVDFNGYGSLINTHRDYNCDFYDVRGENVIILIRARKNIAKGEELFLKYRI